MGGFRGGADHHHDVAALARIALDAGAMGGWDWDLSSHSVRGDATWQDLFRLEGPVHPISAVLDKVDPSGAEALRALRKRIFAREREFMVELRVIHDGCPRWIALRGSVTERDAASRPSRAFGVAWDISERKARDEQETRLLAEMDHRVKNSFAVMEALLNLGKAAPGSKHDFAEMMRAQVHAMAQAHALTTQLAKERNDADVAVPLDQIIETTLAPWTAAARAPNTAVDLRTERGAALPARHVPALTMLLSELAVNALKYGALGPRGGQLKVALTPDGTEHITLHWSERPHEANFTTGEAAGFDEGFGSILIQHCSSVLDGRVTKTLTPRGLDLAITFPIVQTSLA